MERFLDAAVAFRKLMWPLIAVIIMLMATYFHDQMILTNSSSVNLARIEQLEGSQRELREKSMTRDEFATFNATLSQRLDEIHRDVQDMRRMMMDSPDNSLGYQQYKQHKSGGQ